MPGLEVYEWRDVEAGAIPARFADYAVLAVERGALLLRASGVEAVVLAGEVWLQHPEETRDGRPGAEDRLDVRVVVIPRAALEEALTELAPVLGRRLDGGPLPGALFANVIELCEAVAARLPAFEVEGMFVSLLVEIVGGATSTPAVP